MKRIIMSAGFAIVLLVVFSFSNPQPGSIRGKVTPAAYAVNAWAISKTDTLYTTVTNGSFEFANVQPGVYRLIIGAESPYRHTVMDNLAVAAGENTDVGKVSLEKYVTVLK